MFGYYGEAGKAFPWFGVVGIFDFAPISLLCLRHWHEKFSIFPRLGSNFLSSLNST